jgi:hypothetical protein
LNLQVLAYVTDFIGHNVMGMHTMLINKPPDPGKLETFVKLVCNTQRHGVVQGIKNSSELYGIAGIHISCLSLPDNN